MFYAGPGTQTSALDIQTQTWFDYGDSSPLLGNHGFAVMYEPGKVLKSGGVAIGTLDSDVTMTIDLTGSSAVWEPKQMMQFSRRNHNLVLLPDGKILAVGGENNCLTPSDCDFVYDAEVYDPQFDSWSLQAFMAKPRGHHSSAVLLSSGKVLAAAGDGEFSAEIFSPPYLFSGPRPLIASAPAVVGYDKVFSVTISGWSQVTREQITKVSLVRLAAMTHWFDQNQRYVELDFTLPFAPRTLDVESPLNANYAPPGYYMLFLLSDHGVPSMARYIRLE